MKIVSIVPGFGGTFYCGNCLRDSAFVSSLREEGHDATILPMYLPLSIDRHTAQGEPPVFYGAVNIYLKQQFPLFRHMPGWMTHMLDSRPLLRIAARKSGSTRAHGLEQLTESMLLGRDGHQSAELDQLVGYLKHHEKPDIVHFSNALLLGLAKQIREQVGVPVVFSLQDEDVWVDAMEPAWRDHIWALMAEKARDADLFVAVSRYFAGILQEKMAIPPEKMRVVPIGIRPEKYSFAPPGDNTRAIGYISRICEENGFGILTDAFIRLKKTDGFGDFKLIATGGMTGDDQPFIREQQRKLALNGYSGDLEIREEFSGAALDHFFRSVTLLSVPVLKGEAFGLYQIESMASGIPLVQPNLGAFPEIIEATGGGIIYEPNTPERLSGALAELVSNRARILEMSHKGRKAIEEKFDSAKLTKTMIHHYQNLIA